MIINETTCAVCPLEGQDRERPADDFCISSSQAIETSGSSDPPAGMAAQEQKMFDVSARAAGFRLSILAGSAALMLGGLTAAAQAFPVAPIHGAPPGLRAVQYGGTWYGHRMGRHHHWRDHHRYGENDHPRHPGHAGLYDCGPGGKATRLSRKACGGHDRFQHLYR